MAQILFISSGVSLGIITFPSQNVEQNAVCDPIVYLEAIIAGDPTGHTFEWVQMSGSPVVELLPVPGFETKTYYLVPGLPGTDKVFRFYVDRNTDIEQHLDLVVRTTPVSHGKVLQYGFGEPTYIPNPNIFPADFRISVGSPYTPMDNFSSSIAFAPNPATLDLPKPEVFFQSTNDDLYFRDVFVGFVVQQYIDGSGWVTVGAIGSNGPFNITLDTSLKTRVGVIYRRGVGSNEQVIYYDDPLIISPYALSAVEKLGALEYGGSLDTSVTKIIYIIVQMEETDTVPLLMYSSELTTSTERIVYIVDNLLYDETIVALEYTSSYGFSVSRTNGGGSIGG